MEYTMAENGAENGSAPAAGDAAAQPAQMPKMQVMGQFVRDLSFENMMVQKELTGQVTPEVSVQVAMDLKKRPIENQYEVITIYSITSKNQNGGETLFLLELEYSGVFLVENVPEAQLHPYLLIECPRMLFPFVRRLVADLTREGGFPPLNMEVVDFVALYRQMIQAKVAENQAAAADPAKA
jgi:preprotein translocase subunit SecB